MDILYFWTLFIGFLLENSLCYPKSAVTCGKLQAVVSQGFASSGVGQHITLSFHAVHRATLCMGLVNLLSQIEVERENVSDLIDKLKINK